MIVKTIAVLAVALALTFVPASVHAKTVCTQEYGQAVVCREEEEQVLGVHEPIETGIEDYFVPAAGILFAGAIVLQIASRKAKASSFAN